MSPLVLSTTVTNTLPALISQAGERARVRFAGFLPPIFAIPTHDAASPENLLARSKWLFGSRRSVSAAAATRAALGPQPSPHHFIKLSACRGR